jgi:hypothetical protein
MALFVAVPAAVAIGPTSALAASDGASSHPVEPQRSKALKPAHLSAHLHGAHHGKVKVGNRVRVVGYLRPFVPDQHVQVKLLRHGHVIQKLNPKAKRARGENAGRYRFRSPALVKPAGYRVVATHLRSGQQRSASARSPSIHITFPDLDPGDDNSTVRVFNRLLLRQGYYSTRGKRYSNRTSYAVLAYRKTNGMKRTSNASPGIFKKLADGQGSFHLKYPGAGRHVEVDISRQVMVLAKKREPQYTIPVSTGAPATPTIRGHFRFYSRQAGFNSSGMYYSVYFRGGYATHGYHSVPTYPASHGCVRLPMKFAEKLFALTKVGSKVVIEG